MIDLRGVSLLEATIRLEAARAGAHGQPFALLVDRAQSSALQTVLTDSHLVSNCIQHGEDFLFEVQQNPAAVPQTPSGQSPAESDSAAPARGATAEVHSPAGSPAVVTQPAQASQASGCAAAAVQIDESRGVVVFVASQFVGEGDPKLGEILMRSATNVLTGFAPLPRKLIFMNSGVKLTATESPLLADLLHMHEAGVEILSCGTCLDFYGLKESLKVGRISNMVEILGALASADSVLRL